MKDDAQLLLEYIEKQSEAAFTELVRRHLNLVYFSALRRLDGDAAEAKDVAQGVFVLLARKASSLCRHPSLAGWLHSAAVKKASEAIRAERRRRMREREAHTRLEQFSDGAPNANWELLRPVLDEAILKLNAIDREVILLRFFERCTFADLSAKLRLSEDAAKMRAGRSLERLRVQLAKRGITSTAAALVEILTSQAGLSAPAGVASAVTALTSASAPPSALSFLQLLSATNLSLGAAGVLGIAGIAGFGVAAYALQTAARTNAALVAAHHGYDTQLEHLRAMNRSLQAARQSRDGLRKAIDRLRSAEKMADPKADGRSFLAIYPEAREMLAELTRAQIAKNFAFFYKSANLTRSQIDQFEKLLGQTAAKNQAVVPDSIWGDASHPPERELRDILGDQDYRQFQDYNRMAVARELINDAAIEAGYNSTPLSVDQVDRLTLVVADNTSTFPNRPDLDLNSTDWDAVFTQIKSILSDAQWQAVKGKFLDREYRSALAELDEVQGPTGPPVKPTIQ